MPGSASTLLHLPLADGCSCPLIAHFLRSPLNVISLELLPRALLVNRCPLNLAVEEEARGEEDEDELVSRVTSVGCCGAVVLVQDEVGLGCYTCMYM